ncbi:MAG: guanylate kinase [Bacteroidetes bacterium]|nr:MAG: guanylate kinase [Bacteroidota bacterium]
MGNKAVIISAPSGAGKTTIVRHLLSEFPGLEFSISACSRPKRGKEAEGKDYYFITTGQFRDKISKDEFIEWQEVYPGSYYGTLKSEMDRIWSEGKTPIFDVDVFGGINLKKYFGDTALAIFIQPPSREELENRLRHRGTENEKNIQTRLNKVDKELTYAGTFDRIIVNDEFPSSSSKVTELVAEFLDSGIQKGTN